MSKAASIEEIFPLSPLQKGLLFHTLYSPGEAVYFEQLTCELHGRLDEAAFAETWRLLVARHPILRTAFVWKGQREPLQVVHRTLEMPWLREDWRGIPPAQQQEKLAAFLAADRARGFEPNRAPLMRLATLRLSDTVWQLVWSHHHLLLDGWSFPLLLREFGLAYGALSTGAKPALPPARPFGAYLQWLQKRDASTDEQFWRDQLRGFAVPTPLTVDQPGPAGNHYEVIDFALDEADTSRLQQIAREHQVTLSTLSQGAYALVLSRYASTEDVVFGITVSGRPADLPGVENIVGLFINTLPLRVAVPDDAAAGPWLRALQERQLALQEHGHAGLGDIQGWSEVPRGQQLFESLFVFINYPPADTALAARFGELEPRALHFVEKTNYPLTIDVLPGSRLTFRTAFDTARLDRAAVLRLLGHIRRALLGLGTPGARLGHIELVAGEERAALLAASTPTAPVEDLRDRSLHAWFARQAATTPGGTAITAEAGTLTYAELDRAANAIAHRLRALGVQRGTLVGLFLERDAPLLIGLLGILKAGGAYVPLDPIYPDERLDYVLEDSGVPVVVTSPELSARLSNPMIMRLELDAACLHPAADEDSSPLPVVNDCEDPAYVIYTSGSTGRPKGCMVTHRNVLRLFTATEVWYDFNATDVWTFFHSAAFDFSVWEIWGALLYGGRLVVVPYYTSREPAAFCDLLIRERVTILNQTPSAFRQLIKVEETQPDPHALALRYVIFGGEALEFASLRTWFERHGDARPQLVNMYGITETTVFTTYRPLRRADAYEARGSLIGIPIADTPTLVLDARGHLAPLGVPGELHIAGVSLAIGYLNRPELTAQRFVPDPFGVATNGKLYRSGDLARRLPDGDLDYLGRIDDQVKIRGFRIELGEIENVLSTHPAVREVIVLARAESPGAEKRLVAYVVPRGDERITVDVLREHLLARLPEYMVPTAVVALEAFPLTANGKIDRRALPEPSGQLADVSAEYVAPRTEREQKLAEIWRTTLGADRVGVTDSYFALGGDSITGITVCSRAREQGIEFSLQDLFEKQTIEALAAEAAPAAPAAPAPAAPALGAFALLTPEDRNRLPAGLADAYPVTRLQAGMLFHSQGAIRTALYHDVFSHHLRGPLDLTALQAELDALVQRHPVLRTAFDVAAFSEPLQLVHAAAAWPLTSGDLSHLSGPAQEEWLDRFVHDEAQRPFDWSRPPLFRIHVHRRSATEFQFTLSLHHAILDGWSVATLLTELFQHYLARLGRGAAPAAPAPAGVGFRDYVALERAAIADAATRTFWSELLADAAPLELPAPETPGEPGFAHRPIEIPPALAADLNRTAERLGVPLKSVLLAAHLRVLAAVGGRDDVITGLVTNGRPESTGAEHLTGLFLNAVPFRVDLDGCADWAGLVRAVFNLEKALLPHRRLPLAEIQKRQGGSPLFTTDFNFVHFHVYDALRGLNALERLGTRAREETNFTLAANFGVDPQTGALGGTASCDRRVLDGRVIDALPGLYLAALTALATTPDANWRATPLRAPALPAAPLSGETVDWDGADSALPGLLAAQAARTPAAIAVVADDATLTYAELDRRANQLAHWLRRRGVRADDRVAVALERSSALVVALLGALKAGAAYVPVDPGYPPARIAAMLADAAARVVLADSPGIAHGAVAFGAAWPEIAREATTAPAGRCDPDQLAYVVFTSGSTGRPKGVSISHRALVNHMAWMQRAFPLGPDDAVLQKTPTSFDASVWEFWAPLLAGARLVMARPDGHHDPAYLAEAVRTHAVTTLQLVPSVLDFFIEAAARTPCPSLRRIFAGGEALHETTRDRCLATFPGVPLVNLYGPAECTIDATFSVCAPAGPVTLGRPVANLEAWVLDGRLEPVPPGAVGELHLGGDGLARGYLGRPDLTAERFVPHPWQPGARLYRTGDRVRQLADGTLRYLGRADTQVKIRGQRVEPGEIESVLGTHPDIAQAAVVARADEATLRLIAYVVARRAPLDAGALRDWLRARLPEAWVPAAIVPLPRLPLTPGGKLDRRALPAPATPAPARTASTAPLSAVERTLAEIWQRTLNVAHVAPSDNFFELGGDSILSLRVVSLAARAGWQLRALQIFEHPTLAALARVATPVTATAAPEELAVADNLPFTPIQQEFFALQAAVPQHWNQAVFLETRAGLDAATLAEAWRIVTARHSAFRLRFHAQPGGWRQSLAPAEAPLPPFEVVDLARLTPAERTAAIARAADAAQTRFNLARGPLATAVFFDPGVGAPGRLLGVAHHLCVDGVSWRILFEELAQAAEALAAGRPVELPPPTCSFAAWAARVPALAGSATTQAEAAYWQEAAAAPATPLPLDFPDGRAANVEGTTATVTVQLTPDETDRLRRGAPATARCGIDDVLVSALFAALQDWTGADAVRVHLEGHGRDEVPGVPDLSRTVGWFTTLYPVRLAAGPAADAATRLRTVKAALRAVPRGGIGYGWLRHAGTGTPVRAAAPVDVSFNYLGRLDLALDEGGPFRPAADSPGRERAATTRRAHLLDVVAAITAGGLKVDVIFSERAHRRETIERLGQGVVGAVRSLLAQLAAGAAPFAVPADFPLARLTPEEVARLLARGDAEDIWPLAPLQEGMLVHALHDGVAGMYGQQIAFDLRGEPDPAALTRAWQQAAQRHAALRLEFAWEELSAPCQLVRREVAVPLEILDWSDVPAPVQATRWTEWLAADRRRGFTLTAAPLWRVTLVKLAPGRWRLVWSHHHLLLDGWSLPLVFRDLLAAYAAPATALPAAPSYRSYLAWLAPRAPAAAEAFWRNYLRGYRSPPALVVGRPPEGDRARSGGHRSVHVTLPAGATAELKQFAQRHELTLSTCAQAAWAFVLARHLGGEEAVFGLVVSGRPPELAGIESTVGLFINTLPLRVPVAHAEPVAAWLRRLQGATAALREFEASRLIDIQGWSEVPRGQPLFESALIFENYPVDAAITEPVAGLELGPVESFEHTNFPLTLYVLPGRELALRLDYAENRYTDDAMAALVEQVACVLTALARAANRPVATLALEAPAVAARAAAQWNDTARSPWDRTPVHQRFTAQARRTPQAPAVAGDGAVLTFAELEARSNRLARGLRARGAGPGTLVGICLERSPEMVVALLAILKTGAAYVPLDPAFPPARLALMREDSGLRLAVTDEAGAALPGLFTADVTCVRVDADAAAIATLSDEAVSHPSTGDELAYVIFTSGSTGRPKGVQVTHGGLANFLSHFATAPGLAAHDTLLAVTTLSFDIAALELFLPLVTGAKLVLARREVAADARALAGALATHRATVMQATPATWRLLLADDWQPAHPLHVWCGGEAMPRDLAAALLARGCTVLNLYGPTETTIWSALQPVATPDDALAIGRPLAPTPLHLLDAGLNPLPVGVAGELFIGGEGVARGYHGRPDLTAERFVPDPFGPPGARLYATGDLARRLPDGRIEFLGRIDQQVKLRGFRIELGDIESALRAHPAVRAAAVAVHEGPAGKRLVAYIVGPGEAPAAALRDHLRARLPDYMVPAVFVPLATLPLTPNGKLDRRALPAPDGVGATGSEYVAPRDGIETVLADLWREVLTAERVGATDNFFELGGHSLLAAQALARIRKIFQVELPLRTFFETATPEKVAVALAQADPTPGRVAKTAAALLRIRAMTPAERAQARERRPAPAPTAR